jgi:hypothetical protein
MKNTTKTLALTALVAGGLLGAGCSKTEQFDDMKYQGYTINAADGNYTCVFDENTRDIRIGNPELRATSQTKPTMTIGQRYDGEIKTSPIWGTSLKSYEANN